MAVQYSTRVPDCHPDRKHNARGMCNTCYSRWLKKTNPEYRSKQIAATAAAFETKRSVYNARHREKMRAVRQTPEFKHQQRWRKVKFRYGLTEDQFVDLWAKQGGKCPLCDRAIAAAGRSTHIDHDHATGAVRGILCASCNSLLGKLERNPDIVRRSAAYLGREW